MRMRLLRFVGGGAAMVGGIGVRATPDLQTQQ